MEGKVGMRSESDERGMKFSVKDKVRYQVQLDNEGQKPPWF